MTAGHCGFKRSPVNNIEVGRRKGKEEEGESGKRGEDEREEWEGG